MKQGEQFTDTLAKEIAQKTGAWAIYLTEPSTDYDPNYNKIERNLYKAEIENLVKKKKIETEKEKLISDLKKSKEALEKETLKVKKLNSNLLDSQNELKEHIATKDKFFSIISHDLRGPISAFLNLTDLLLSEMEEMSWKELKETMKMMHSSALGVNRLLNNLLQWSRLQRGKLDFTPANYNLKFIIDNGIDILKSSARDKSINIINLVADDIIVYADSNMLDLVIRNLISNSIKFTNEGGTITISSSKKNKKLIIVSITDTGIGIEPKNLEKLFRIDEKITTEGTKGELGSGLGLILCKEFVEKNGGKISVKSSIGKGTTFTFSIPSGA
jgi:signal transduction histidine kinase